MRRKQMAAAVRSGSTVPQAARTFGVTIRTVQSACKEFGVQSAEAAYPRARRN